jgi:phosphoenolpyruvate carboxylase
MFCAQAGDAGFERIEAIRQTAIRFRRAAASDAGVVKDELSVLLNDLSIADTLDVVRAFSYFSHLANIAEDVHQNRRRRAHALAGSGPQRGSIADALDRIAAQGTPAQAIARFVADALVSPVLTAHPTEVQRKSILDCEREIVRLLQWRDRVALTPEETTEFESGLYRQVLALWQTAMIRLSKLKVKTRSTTALLIIATRFFSRCHGSLSRSRAACPPTGEDGASRRRCCGRDPGSAAIATAIRSSLPKRSSMR